MPDLQKSQKKPDLVTK